MQTGIHQPNEVSNLIRILYELMEKNETFSRYLPMIEFLDRLNGNLTFIKCIATS
ncbi:MAG: hypothetical protein ACE5KU_04160 [Nitrososphaerales archaeon]